ncbi:transmembrane protein 60-like [Ditylenchus destructor]|uniref:Transmembrane protein 60-like n=1 Tax=Ditylenchus destructor TaxID=166010 RepID=A0AAD4NFI7_9BILA|nr:transmembrane protein 60-like [Ditylenchus destructor]
MGIGQRALFVWVFTLLTLIFLVVYLDGGLDREPLIFFVLLWLLDAFCFGMLALRCVRYYYNAPDEPIGFACDMPKLSFGQFALASVVIISKLAFEIILCARLRGNPIDMLWVMLPLWLCLGFVIGDLSLKIADVHRKIR